MAYTFSRTTDNGAGRNDLLPNAYDDSGYYGISDLDRPHVLVSHQPDGRGVVDDALARLGLSRTVVLRVSHFLLVPVGMAIQAGSGATKAQLQALVETSLAMWPAK